MKSKSRSELADLHLSLLVLEWEEEIERQRQLTKDRESTLELGVESADSERDVYVLTLRHESKRCLPKHCIDKGSRVSVSLFPIVDLEDEDVASDSAVVTKVTSVYLTLTFSYEPDICRGMTVFIKKTESTDYVQLSKAMEWLKNVETDVTNHSDEPNVHLVQVMFKEHRQELAVPGSDVHHAVKASPLLFIDQRLDMSQRKAVELALCNRWLTVIHGPPGTGKTTTLVEVILQHVQRGKRVLVCAPSNKAVDNLLKGLWKQTRKAVCKLRMMDVIRLGNLARMDEKHRRFSFTVRLKKRLKKTKRSGTSSFLKKQERIREMAKLLKEVIVVMSTLTCVSSVKLDKTYDLLVIDECAQATEAACWLAIPFARKVLLAGDPCQLPPTIFSQEAARRGLAVSLMERQMELHGKDVVHMLDTQYRMHELIQAWSSRNLYSGRLKAAPEVCSHLLTELPGVRSTKRTQPTLLLVDTDGCKLKETRDAKTKSYSNNGEADIVVRHARSLVKAGLRAEDIGVITPYKQQVKLIARKMFAAWLDVEVNSVDGYQGSEKEAILLSLVRSNARHQVGFVSNIRRLNVAVTRARRHLFVVCDTATVCQDETIRSLVRHMEQSGEARSTYCDQFPREKDGRGRGSSAASDPLVSAAGVPDLRKPTPSAKDDFDTAPVSRLAISMGAIMLKRQDMELVHSSGAATLAQDVKESDSLAEDVKESDSLAQDAKESDSLAEDVKESDSLAQDVKESDSLAQDVKESDSLAQDAKDSDSLAQDAKDSDSLAQDAKESDSLAEDVKESDSLAQYVKESNSLARDVKESDPLAEDVKESEALAEDVKESDSLAEDIKESDSLDCVVNVSDSCDPAVIVSYICDSGVEVPDTSGSAVEPSVTCDSAPKVSDTGGSAFKGVDSCDVIVKVFDSCDSAVKASDTCDSVLKVIDMRDSAVEVIGTFDSAAKTLDNCDPAVEVLDTYGPAVEVIEPRGSAAFDYCDYCRIL